jgi:outer membrane lipoprotein-sorting protein
MKRSSALNAALMLLILVCLALVPARGSCRTWVDLSKRLNDRCVIFNRDVRDITLAMEMTNPSSAGALTTQTVFYQKGERFRAEVAMGDVERVVTPVGTADDKVIIICDGASLWIVSAAMGKTEIPSSEKSKYRGQWYCADYVPADAEIVGSERIGGRACHVVAVRDEKSDYTKLWVDKKSLGVVKTESKLQEGETTVTLFSDFRRVFGDFELPYRTETYSGKDLISTTIIKSIKLNSDIADGLFDPDAPAGEVPGAKWEKMKIKIEELEDD